MNWLKRRRLDTEEAARKLASNERQIVDQAARLVRIEADIAIYTLKKKGSE